MRLWALTYYRVARFISFGWVLEATNHYSFSYCVGNNTIAYLKIKLAKYGASLNRSTKCCQDFYFIFQIMLETKKKKKKNGHVKVVQHEAQSIAIFL